MRWLYVCFLCLLYGLLGALANVEKVVFLAPALVNGLARPLPALESPHIERLSHSELSLRRQLHARFDHSPDQSEPAEAWVLLEALHPGQRYEVRVCWSASVSTCMQLFAPATDSAATHVV